MKYAPLHQAIDLLHEVTLILHVAKQSPFVFA